MQSVDLDAIADRLARSESPAESRADLRPAAVLLLMYPRDGEVWIPLIERPSHQRTHAGQLALPGGAQDVRDGSLIDTALRESQEEVGLQPETVRILGRLPPVPVGVSGFRVWPIVGWCEEAPDLIANDAEVAAIVEMPLGTLLDPNGVSKVPAPPGSNYTMVYEIFVGDLRVWGATARMLASFSSVVREAATDGAAPV